MLHNPFTPSEIATGPDDFFGRSAELELLERGINIGSVAIQGAIGIGKSSLLANFLRMIDDNGVTSVVAVSNSDLSSIDDVARIVLENLISIDEKQHKLILKVPELVEMESAEVTKYYQDGRHLAVLQRIIQKDFADWLLRDSKWLVIAIDEADKCPVHTARFFRSLVTHTQQNGINTLRFIFCGVRPFYQEMCNTDRGVARFISRNISLSLLPPEEAEELLTTKFKAVADAAFEDGLDLEIDPRLISYIQRISGGHPHLLQLLGSHVVEREAENPDGRLDIYDLVPALNRICYEDRIEIHEATLHAVEVYGYEDAFFDLLSRMHSFPSRINRRLAKEIAGPEALEWFLANNVLVIDDTDSYTLVDEFLRLRLIMDGEEYENRIITELSHRERLNRTSHDPSPYYEFDDERDFEY